MKLSVLRQVHLTHSAFAKLRADFVTAEFSTAVNCHFRNSLQNIHDFLSDRIPQPRRVLCPCLSLCFVGFQAHASSIQLLRKVFKLRTILQHKDSHMSPRRISFLRHVSRNRDERAVLLSVAIDRFGDISFVTAAYAPSSAWACAATFSPAFLAS